MIRHGTCDKSYLMKWLDAERELIRRGVPLKPVQPGEFPTFPQPKLDRFPVVPPPLSEKLRPRQ